MEDKKFEDSSMEPKVIKMDAGSMARLAPVGGLKDALLQSTEIDGETKFYITKLYERMMFIIIVVALLSLVVGLVIGGIIAWEWAESLAGNALEVGS